VTDGKDVQKRDLSFYVRRSWRRLLLSSKRQFILIGTVFVVVFLLSRNGGLMEIYFPISDERMVGFLSTLSQAIAALLALLIAAMLFSFERIKHDKQTSFDLFKSEMANLVRIYRDRPESLKPLDGCISNIIENFAYLRPGQINNWLDEKPETSSVSWSEASEALYRALQEHDLRLATLSREDGYHLRQILMTLDNVESAQDALNKHILSGVVTRKPLEVVLKLFVLLVVALFYLVLFSVQDVRGVIPDFRLPVLFALLTWTALSLAELAQEIRDLQDEIEYP
jgi:hypothetical protein